jgi:predicted MPP superfamily phosphohydrolase
MDRIFPVLLSTFSFVVITTATVLLLKFLHSVWWRQKWIKVTIMVIPLTGIAGSLVWYLGYVINNRQISHSAAVTTAFIFMLMFSLLLSLPLSGLVHLILKLVGYYKRTKKIHESKTSLGRRRAIRNIAALFPATFMTSQAAGVAGSFKEISIPVHRLKIVGLPDELVGLKIAHLSDSHIGPYITVGDFENIIEKISSHKPDLVAMTGDIADDLTVLESTNNIVNNLNPRYGVHASIGNHEYYRGFKRVLSIYEKSPFPLLLNQASRVNINGVDVTIGGIDDPVSLKREKPEFFMDVIDRTFDGSSSDSFKIMLSHRPKGLNYASEVGVNLVLAGHTHGGQVGLLGRSVFEPMMPDVYLWGTYRRKNTTLYTSSGMGHWMPFRLGCPAEAPILVLERA